MFNFAIINFYEHLKTEVSDIMSLFRNLTTSDQSGYLYSRKNWLTFSTVCTEFEFSEDL